MEDKNLSKEVLISLYKNAHIALQSISSVMNETDDETVRKELSEEYDGYEKYVGKLSSYLRENGVEAKEGGPMKKAMIHAGVKMNAMADKSRSHIAEMMIKGTVCGITELRELLNGNGEELSDEVKKYAEELLDLEETYEESLKKLL